MMTTTIRPPTQLSRIARADYQSLAGEPFLVCDWDRAVFLHYAVDAETLATQVPFELDCYQGRAYVSMVAFTMRRLRISRAGRMINWLLAPAANQGFLNVRTYVRHQGQPGIYFLAEWLTSRLSVFFGPRLYGLPFHYGQLDYRHTHEVGRLLGRVTPDDSSRRLRYRAYVDPDSQYQPCEADSLDEFLLERYIAFTIRGGVERQFHVWHEPWPQTRLEPNVLDDSLATLTGAWSKKVDLIGAHYSTGVTDVWMSRPICINGPGCRRNWPIPAEQAVTASTIKERPL